MDIYQEEILDHFKNPQNFGELDNADKVCTKHNTTCGDSIVVSIVLEKDKVVDIKFKGEGCAISMASASMLIEKLKGMSVEEIKKLDAKYVTEMLGVTLNPSRLKCALLSLDCVKEGIE